MNAIEVNVILTKAALIDPFIVPDPDRAEEWAEVLDGVSFDEGLAAMRAHYATSSDRLMPAHILARVGGAESRVPDITGEVLEQSKREALAAAGVTEAEFDAHQNDRAWLAAHFPEHMEALRG